ncbi:PDZ domain-containing protein 9 isoform X2 [Pelodiscus sinensis]|uniref:PDZ domain-containing protein 9 isoform X2 n=1 Tax=Pelodiscus sinensis TaxID=13735 RepID=UPI000703C6BF|nr:PDZ domain-containing protein 9 isoform X1 [Pelodiscus sinensis]|eukprot:XP_014429428.1 PDZ domain-containing protein 9 isoform X1 [Pelodiscus sinensis]
MEMDQYQFPALEKISEHTLSATLKTNIKMGEQGLGLIVIQNGPYLQITSLVQKGSAAKNGRLKPGDILIKIGHANILGWTLRELWQLLHNIPIGTVLQIRVYRDFVEVPQHWKNLLELVPEVKPLVKTDTSSKDSEAKEDSWTSSDDYDDVDSDERFRYKTAQSFCYDSNKLPSISKTWHAFKRKKHTFTVGADIGCDIIIHKDVDVWCSSDFATNSISPPSYWTMEMPNSESSSSSSSSSSISDAFWLEEFASVLE